MRKINEIEFLISEILNDSNFIHDEFVSINNLLNEYDKITEKNRNTTKKCQIIRHKKDNNLKFKIYLFIHNEALFSLKTDKKLKPLSNIQI